ncbi:hypothetical protein C8J57DRAFT_1340416, partial [Mycena rebaudengoi]
MWVAGPRLWSRAVVLVSVRVVAGDVLGGGGDEARMVYLSVRGAAARMLHADPEAAARMCVPLVPEALLLTRPSQQHFESIRVSSRLRAL